MIDFIDDDRFIKLHEVLIMTELPNHFTYYDTIIGRFNEIFLKSRKTRARMESRLMDYIKAICRREQIELKSAKNKWGRLIFEIPNHQIPQAVVVFRYIIGLHSFSPCLTVAKDYEVIKEAIVSYSRGYLQTGDTFVVRASRIKPFPFTSVEVERQLGELVLDTFEADGKSLKVNLKNPDKTLYVEIRQDETFIYGIKIPTLWGGNPLEFDKALLAPWIGQKDEAVASQLLMRRGSLILPLIFESDLQSNSIPLESVLDQIRNLARYQTQPLDVFKIDDKKLNEIILQQLSSPFLSEYSQKFQNESDGIKNEFSEIIKIIVRFQILTYFITKLNESQQFHYNKRYLQFKGVISPNNIKDTILYCIAQRFPIVHFMPLVGLSPKMLNLLSERIDGDHLKYQNSSAEEVMIDFFDKAAHHDMNIFSLGDVVISQISRSEKNFEENSIIPEESNSNEETISPTDNIFVKTEILDKTFSFVLDCFELDSVKKIVAEILDTYEKFTISALILS